MQKNTRTTEYKEHKRTLITQNKRNTKEHSYHRTKGIQKKTYNTEQKENKRTHIPQNKRNTKEHS